ncbi:BACON domain-containing protein [Porphyromonas levii]|uniref:BACON domain-containing protein n=1 Tax=Porphyromonas levii TaxID=28114 RepID=UPI001B8CB5C7|nr:BACON domain-containing protein [Porphyromonas levii]MBR8712994.1 hypothetical protein [Porphyromonas levii]MBR8715041.1 hypothetical protein [Porphyromonas levii]MBR8727526.1 hypothetical protein [Porphyromonas levii]MBR8774212.1 hypothetical protein [Porphyromonas levii]MBR8777933.1 hypothetical protein [Porphyromonas levii]
MKKTAILLPLILLLVGISMTSCSNKDLEVVSLEISEFGTLNIGAEGEKKTIEVTTNQNNWVVTANESWIEIDQQENNFTFSVPNNEMPIERKASILVIAGGQARKLEIIQAAGKGTLYVGEEKLQFDQFAQEHLVRVVSNGSAWNVEVSGSTWLKAEQIAEENRLRIIVEENTSTKPRSGKVFVKSAGLVREINVEQGAKVMYMLPLLIPGSNIEDVQKYEDQRKSKLVINTSYLTGGAHTYRTISPLFPKIEYNFSNEKINEIDMIPSDVSILTSEGLHNFLLENGYESKGDNGHEKPYVKMVKVGEANFEIRIQILYSVPRMPKVVKFLIIRRQPNAMPTFNEVPKGFNNISNGTKADAIAWEASNGGKMSQSKSIGNFYYFDVLDKLYIGRDYIFSEAGDSIKMMRLFTYDISKAFYKAAENNYQMTDEFKALLEREGFTNPIETGDKYKKLYRNNKYKSLLGVRVAQITEVNGGAPVVEFMYLPLSFLKEKNKSN